MNIQTFFAENPVLATVLVSILVPTITSFFQYRTTIRQLRATFKMQNSKIHFDAMMSAYSDLMMATGSILIANSSDEIKHLEATGHRARLFATPETDSKIAYFIEVASLYMMHRLQNTATDEQARNFYAAYEAATLSMQKDIAEYKQQNTI